MSAPTRVLVVDDEPLILRALQTSLGAAGSRVRPAATPAAALEAAAAWSPQAVVLDLRLPDGDGGEVCRRLRDWSRVPVIVVSALDGEPDKVAALDAGADDYVTKPYAVGELLARLRAALRRAEAEADDGPVVAFGEISIDLHRREVRRAGTRVHLTPLEYGLLAELARHPGRVLTHAALLRAVWGLDHRGETRYLRVYMANLRRKLEADTSRPRHLLTHTGVGYRLSVD